MDWTIGLLFLPVRCPMDWTSPMILLDWTGRTSLDWTGRTAVRYRTETITPVIIALHVQFIRKPLFSMLTLFILISERLNV